MKLRAAVIGHPISHSLSPAIFGFLCNYFSFDKLEYYAQAVEAAGLSEFVQRFRSQNDWIGLNVTIPHKVSIIPLVDYLSHEVKIVGAANVVHHENGQLTAFNTDVYGIERTLLRHAVTTPWEQQRAVVFGAGGAARAVAYVLGKKKFHRVDLLNRNEKNAQSLAIQMKDVFPETDWQPSTFEMNTCSVSPSSEPVSLWINTTPLGMNENGTALLKSRAWFQQVFNDPRFSLMAGGTAFDLIYKPEQTAFLEAAKSVGLFPLGGLEMLAEQAMATWGIWFAPVLDPEAVKVKLMDFLRSRPIFLTGMMGAGKSTVGPLLARKLGRKFVDLDQVIELETGQTVRTIFTDQGETGFREIEARVFSRHAFSSNAVISLGGGTLTQEKCLFMAKKAGSLMYLSAQPTTLVKRISEQGIPRPLLDGLNDVGKITKIEEILKLRDLSYQQADCRVETDELTSSEVAGLLADKIAGTGGLGGADARK